jgi:hypothetical protein
LFRESVGETIVMLFFVASNFKHFEDMIRIVDVGFFVTQLVTVALLVFTFSLHETSLLLVSLFYGKCYVTMFIRELLRSPIAIGENFFLKKMRRNCLESFFFHRKRRFLFFFSFVSRIDCFFLSVSSATFYIFFGSSMT